MNEELRALAEKATPGPWRASGTTIWRPASPDDPTDFSGVAVAYVPTLSDEFDSPDPAYIAAANPTAVLALLDDRARIARFLLDIGYGTDFNSAAILPPVAVLEEMVRLAADDPSFVRGISEAEHLEAAYFVLSSELGDWRAAA